MPAGIEWPAAAPLLWQLANYGGLLMRFALFDQVEHTGQPLHKVYADRLRLLQVADEAGFWCYFKSEHHFTPLDVAPSLGAWLAAVAARTSKMRIGPLVYLLPFHHPIQLLEEIAMLDHLSEGRLELGVGRGISPPEHEMWGLEKELARERSEETLKILLAGMTSDSLTFEGRFWNFHEVPIQIRPLQKPYPPLWYPGNLDVAGQRGFHTVTAGSATDVARAVKQFAGINKEHAGAAGRVNPGSTPKLGAVQRVFLSGNADTALERGRVAWKHFDHNITLLWRRAGITELPLNPTADGDFDKAAAWGLAFAGTPAMLREHLEGYRDVDPMILCFEWGDLDASEVRRSMELFIEQVMPGMQDH